MITKQGFGLAFGLPIETAVEQLHATARELEAAAEKVSARGESFGQRIKAAVQRRLSCSHGPRADGGESFGQKVKQAVERRSGRTQHARQTDAERSRYRQQLRKRTMGE